MGRYTADEPNGVLKFIYSYAQLLAQEIDFHVVSIRITQRQSLF